MNITNGQKLRLLSQYFDAVKKGNKKSTIRAGRRKISEGELIFESSDGNLKVFVKKVIYKRFYELTSEDARLDGFENLETLHKALLTIYPNLKTDAILTIIHFEFPGSNNY